MLLSDVGRIHILCAENRLLGGIYNKQAFPRLKIFSPVSLLGDSVRVGIGCLRFEIVAFVAECLGTFPLTA